MSLYLFFLPTEDGWQIATRGGKVVTVSNTGHYGGRMPVVLAGDIFLDTIPNEPLVDPDLELAFIASE